VPTSATILEASVTTEAELFVNEDLVVPRALRIGSGIAVVYSSKCPDERPKNEDCAAVCSFGDHESGVLAVADGAGGLRGAAQASGIAVELLKSSLNGGPQDASNLRPAILNAFEDANAAVMALGIGAATTLSVVEIQDQLVRPYHVGDSDIMVVGQRGKVKAHAVPHSPVGYAVEAGVLNERDALHHEDRHLVSNLIGSPDMHIQVGAPVRLSKYDTVLVASDGLADNLHQSEIVDLIRKGPLEIAANSLAQLALDRMHNPVEGEPSKPDDVTFILFRLEKPYG
jgi:serine/threonine protein phosphatase PrpC